jgi:hypothetical protein
MAQAIGTVIFGLFIYCLTYSLSVVLRSGLKGVAASMAIIFGSEGFSAAIRFRWHINVPVPTLPIGSLPPIVSNLVWMGFALLFIVGAQFAIERAEI